MTLFKTTQEELVFHLKCDLKIEENALCFVHFDPVGMGAFDNGVNDIIDAFYEVLPQGVFISPAFTHSWAKGSSFDQAESPDKSVGTIARLLVESGRLSRTRNPNFSTVFFDNSDSNLRSRALSDGATKSCFGEASIFGLAAIYAETLPAYCILLGGAHRDCVFRSTVIHHVEELSGVPYRYVKVFENPLQTFTDSTRVDRVEQFVRYLTIDEYTRRNGHSQPEFSIPVNQSFEKLGNDLLKDFFFRSVPFKLFPTRLVQLSPFNNWLYERLKEDILYLLK